MPIVGIVEDGNAVSVCFRARRSDEAANAGCCDAKGSELSCDISIEGHESGVLFVWAAWPLR